MGSSYQTMLVVGDLPAVRAALVQAGIDGLVMPAGPDRVAVMPREGDYDYADTRTIAQMISGRYGFATLSNRVYDSEVVYLDAYRDGHLWHAYLSDQSILVEWFLDDDGNPKFRFDGIEHPPEGPAPTGALGADPNALAPYGVGNIDLDRLAAALRGPDEDEYLMAEHQHWLILEALNLDPRGLTTAYRHTGSVTLPGAEPITTNQHPRAGATGEDCFPTPG